ncbi:50S ribosomal protein L9 [Candidatus Providencia siddallii]|uniref:Large ribosomal subunit protein bL9 n=1 Tax=Candidatus Providencia siddallii TaxID=1715285 RepID=A0ABP1CEC2_9GAMM
MQVILLDKVTNLGNLGDVVNVKSGYARNYLIPYKKAVLATKKNINFFESQQNKLKTELTNILTLAKNRASILNQIGSIKIYAKAGNEGKLFGSIGIRDIVKSITDIGVEIKKNEIKLPNGILRTIGNHEIGLQLHNDVFIKFIVIIIAE